MKRRNAVLIAAIGSLAIAAFALPRLTQRGHFWGMGPKSEAATCSTTNTLVLTQSAPHDAVSDPHPFVGEKNSATLTPEALERLLGGTPLETLIEYVNTRSSREEALRNAGFFESWDWKDQEGQKKYKKLTLDALQPLIREFEKAPWPLDKDGDEETLYYRSSLNVRLPDTDAHWLIVAEVRVWNGKKDVLAYLRDNPEMLSVGASIYSEDRPKPHSHYYHQGQQLMGAYFRDNRPLFHGLRQWAEPHFTDDLLDIALPLPWSQSAEGFAYSRSQKKWIAVTIEPWKKLTSRENEEILVEYRSDYTPPTPDQPGE